MKKKWNWSQLILATATVALLVSGSILFAAKGGNGGGKPGGDDPPASNLPVSYQVKFFDMPYTNTEFACKDCNNNGQVVGHMWGDGTPDEQSAFVYDPFVDADFAIDLNSIVDGIPDGWVIRRATAIKANGDIAAYIKDETNPEFAVRAAMIDMSAMTPQLHLIDEDLLLDEIDGYVGEFSVASDMNDVGDIAVGYERIDGSIGVFVYNFGLYDLLDITVVPLDLRIDIGFYISPKINNSANGRGSQVITRLTGYWGDCVIYTLGEGLTVLDPYIASNGSIYEWLEVSAINDSAQIAGRIHIDNQKRNKWLQTIWDGGYTTSESVGTVRAFNESADVLTRYSFNHQTYGAVDPLSLLDPADTNSSVVGTFVRGGFAVMTDRNDTDFPVLFASGDYDVDGVTVMRGSVFYPVSKP